MALIQLDFFKSDEQCEIEALREEVRALKTSLDKQRRKQFSLIGEIGKGLRELEERYVIIERNICKSG